MLKFTAVSDNLNFIGASANHSILINKIMLVGASTHYIESGIRGSLVCNSAVHNDYIELEFDGNNEHWENVNQLVLLSDDLQIATLSIDPINKSEDDTFRYRFTAEFEYTEKLLFESVRTSVPYATNYGDGLVKFYSPSDDALAKSNTVYTASDVDGIVSNLSGNYVTLDTEQTITGAKTFEDDVKISDPDNANHYIDIGSSTTSTSGTTWSTINYVNLDKTAYADTALECSGNGHNVNYLNELNWFNEDGTAVLGTSNIIQSVQKHYNVIASDACLTTDNVRTIPHSFAEEQIAAGDEHKENYQERIRVRKTQSVDNPDDINTYIDLYADHIKTVGNDIHFKTRVYEQGADGALTVSTEELLTISNEIGVYSTKFAGGYVIDNESYEFGSAGSLTTDFAITDNADDNHAPTSKAVKAYVGEAIVNSQEAVITSISNMDAVGSMGLFLYTEHGDQKSYGDTVDGAYLKPVGMSLSHSGQILYTAQELEAPLTGVWKLMSFAMVRTSDAQCLVLAQKISNDV